MIASEAQDFLSICETFPITSEEQLLENIANLTIQLYASTADFFILHTVTATQALRKVLPFVDQKLKPFVLRGFFRAITVAYIAQGAPKIVDIEIDQTLENVEWDEILSKACQSIDDHVIKFGS